MHLSGTLPVSPNVRKNILSWALAGRPVVSCSFARGLYSLPAGVLRMRGACALPLFVVYLRNFPWLSLAGKVGWESPCPLGKVLTYKNLIYLLNFLFYCVNTSYLVDRCRITTHWMEGSLRKGNS